MGGKVLHNAKRQRLVCTSFPEVNDVSFSSSRNCLTKMIEIIPNEDASAQKLTQEERENLGNVGFQIFKQNLTSSVRKEKKFNPNLTLC